MGGAGGLTHAEQPTGTIKDMMKAQLQFTFEMAIFEEGIHQPDVTGWSEPRLPLLRAIWYLPFLSLSLRHPSGRQLHSLSIDTLSSLALSRSLFLSLSLSLSCSLSLWRDK